MTMQEISKDTLRRVGWVLSALPILFMSVDAFGKLQELAPVVEGTAQLGFPVDSLIGIGAIELIAVVLYAVPRTAMLGAVLLTGFLGGATAAHVRLEQPFWFPIAVGLVIWAGLCLREPRLRGLLRSGNE